MEVQMKVLLTIPPFVNNDYYMPSLGVYILARTLMDSGFKVEVIDFSFEIKIGNINADENIYSTCVDSILKHRPDVICFSCNCMTILPAIQMASKIKKKNKLPIIVGGPIATTNPYDIIKYKTIDYVVVGEGEYSLPYLIANMGSDERLKEVDVLFRKNNSIIRGMNNKLIDYDSYDIIPAYELMPKEKDILFINYGKVFIPCEAGRGCAFRCAFCCSDTIWQRKVKFFNISLVKKQIEAIQKRYNNATIYFTCDNLIYNNALVEKICHLMTSKGLKWQCRGRLDIDCNYSQMHNAGCEMMMVGIESAQQKTWTKIHKGVFPKDLLERVTKITNSGIGVTASYIIGFPFEDDDDMLNTICNAFQIAKCENSDVTIHALTPLPLTQLYQENSDIYFNDITDLVSGVKFSNKLFPSDIELIKSDKELFLAFYCFKSTNKYNSCFVKLAHTATILCKTPIFASAIFDSYISIKELPHLIIEYYDEFGEFADASDIPYFLLERIIASKEEIVALSELYEIESCLNNVKKYHFNNTTVSPAIQLLLANGLFCFIISSNLSKAFESKSFVDCIKNNDNSSCKYLFVYNPQTKKYALTLSNLTEYGSMYIYNKLQNYD